MPSPKTVAVTVEVALERANQDKKWGEQNHPDGTEVWAFKHRADVYRQLADEAAGAGSLTWADILLEEVYEALAEEEPALLRAELIQVAAVAVAWIEAIDRRPK